MTQQFSADAHTLRFDAPAQEFTQALPLGNGRLGAMCYGGIRGGKIQLNEATAWSGSPGSEAANGPALLDGPEVIDRARQALAAGDHATAEAELATVTRGHTQSYLPFADVLLGLDFREPDELDDEPEDYRRSLDLRRAVHEHGYTVAGRTITERAYVSAVHQVLVVDIQVAGKPLPKATVSLASQLRVEATETQPGSLNLHLRLPTNVAPNYANPPTGVQYDQPGRDSMRGAVVLRWEHDGTDLGTAAGTDDDGTLAAAGVSRLRLVVSTGTTFDGLGLPLNLDENAAMARATTLAEAASALSTEELFSAHVAAHGELYNRAELDLGEPHGDQAQPLNQRLLQSPGDPALAALLFNYGRYLLISSSRPGTLPGNLQGIWNESMQPPWSSNYTININTQMNYWAAEGANLAECHEPLFDLLEALAVAGRATARTVYGLDGWVAHHNTDAWAFTSPVAGDTSWSFWPMGGAWLATHLWEHVRHGGGSDFAAQRAWPVIKGASEFALGWLIPQPDGTLGTTPSTSPENHFRTAEGVIAAASHSSTADLAIIGRLFRAALELAPAGEPLVAHIRNALGRLPAIPVAHDGTVQEWAEPFEQPEPTHRHVSHLYFAYPGETELSAELGAAVSKTLDARGDDSTGWSLAWKLALRARLKDTGAVDRLLPLMFRTAGEQHGPHAGGLYPNMFAAHPPFQIDGNFGFVAGVLECLVQSHAGRIDLLPAVPTLWPVGTARGLVVRPGLELDLQWSSESGKQALVSARLRARTPETAGEVKLTWDGRTAAVHVNETTWTELGPEDFS
ncbi:glycosyl hydrolase family 95 catalytic domain-containing protein [Arthrobacter alpinus]|uniref:glycoside hydrolase family 95 protein n=1 Tax=Arthrobacter alpinus TaxID=656366 RepID=UPI000A8BBEF0|nr:glycoside hydrolase family 95 protein [Arthrobacter alpinus]